MQGKMVLGLIPDVRSMDLGIVRELDNLYLHFKLLSIKCVS